MHNIPSVPMDATASGKNEIKLVIQVHNLALAILLSFRIPHGERRLLFADVRSPRQAVSSLKRHDHPCVIRVSNSC